MGETIVGSDGKSRCSWCGAAPEFLAYHDTEWGFPVSDDYRLFEKLVCYFAFFAATCSISRPKVIIAIQFKL